MKTLFIAATSAMLVLGGCNLTQNEATVLGGVAGAAGGLLLADALNANPNWTIVAALGGAAAGALVARNTRTGDCAYSNGRGQYYRAACP
jgi:osmotically inducible lipoprotein OsmB